MMDIMDQLEADELARYKLLDFIECGIVKSVSYSFVTEARDIYTTELFTYVLDDLHSQGAVPIVKIVLDIETDDLLTRLPLTPEIGYVLIEYLFCRVLPMSDRIVDIKEYADSIGQYILFDELYDTCIVVNIGGIDVKSVLSMDDLQREIYDFYVRILYKIIENADNLQIVYLGISKRNTIGLCLFDTNSE